jgi:hypothetical protein
MGHCWERLAPVSDRSRSVGKQSREILGEQCTIALLKERRGQIAYTQEGRARRSR